uniref:helix-turn-helix domain-containing protein n=1 Tax=Microbacterium sp. K22 TaxID=2305447 RepID=UPI001F0D4F6C
GYSTDAAVLADLQESHPHPFLSLRERQILALIADALTNRQIADRLGLAEKTIKNYVTSMLGKLGFTHRTQAAVFELSRIHDDG